MIKTNLLKGSPKEKKNENRKESEVVQCMICQKQFPSSTTPIRPFSIFFLLFPQ